MKKISIIIVLLVGILLNTSISAATPVIWYDEQPANQVPEEFKPAYNVDYSDNPENAKVIARLVNCNAHTGNYAVALGFNDQKGTDTKLDFMFRYLKPNTTFVVSFAVKVFGENTKASVGMQSGKDYSYYAFNQTPFTEKDFGEWRYLSYEYTYNQAVPFDIITYFYLTIYFKGPAKSGMLIDTISVREKGLESDYRRAPNIAPIGNFEAFTDKTTDKNLVWNDRYIYIEPQVNESSISNDAVSSEISSGTNQTSQTSQNSEVSGASEVVNSDTSEIISSNISSSSNPVTPKPSSNSNNTNLIIIIGILAVAALIGGALVIKTLQNRKGQKQ
jgi:hypothetical protein